MMICNNKRVVLLIAAALTVNVGCFSQTSAIIQTKYTADPAPMVYNNTVYLYTSHDEDNANGFEMHNWLLYTSKDMANWTDKGIVASLATFSWAKHDNSAWAPQCIERNGKFYLYCPVYTQKENKFAIGVAVADNPCGPFKDPIGKPLVLTQYYGDWDPTVFIDDDGQAYMYWGHARPFYVKLNKDMISYSGSVQSTNVPDHYQEGPWVYKRKGHYYLVYASTCCPEGIGYAMSDKPTGPWIYKGYVMRPTEKSRGNHPGIIDFRGKSYCFGLSYDLLHYQYAQAHQEYQHHERRSVAVSRMFYNQDGTIKEVPYWSKDFVKQIEYLNPYHKVEAVTMAWGLGLKTEKLNNNNLCVTNISDGKYIRVRGLDFGKVGATKFVASLSCTSLGGKIEIRLDGVNGKQIGILPVSNTGSSSAWKLFSTKISRVKGVHDLFLVFRGDKDNLFNMDYWMFKR